MSASSANIGMTWETSVSDVCQLYLHMLLHNPLIFWGVQRTYESIARQNIQMISTKEATLYWRFNRLPLLLLGYGSEMRRPTHQEQWTYGNLPQNNWSVHIRAKITSTFLRIEHIIQERKIETDQRPQKEAILHSFVVYAESWVCCGPEWNNMAAVTFSTYNSMEKILHVRENLH